MLHELRRIYQAHQLTSKPYWRLAIQKIHPEDCIKRNRDDKATPQSRVNAQNAIKGVIFNVGSSLI
jgi:hypothetical protein